VLTLSRKEKDMAQDEEIAQRFWTIVSLAGPEHKPFYGGVLGVFSTLERANEVVAHWKLYDAVIGEKHRYQVWSHALDKFPDLEASDRVTTAVKRRDSGS